MRYIITKEEETKKATTETLETKVRSVRTGQTVSINDIYLTDETELVKAGNGYILRDKYSFQRLDIYLRV